ncbi:MAG: ester cyclase [Saprospiraceae bacterium]
MKKSINQLGLLAVISFIAFITINASDPSDNKKVAKDFYNSYNKHDLQKSFDDFISKDLVNRTMGGGMDREKWLNFDESVIAACPNLKMTVKEQMAEGNKVITHWISEGTHTGDFMGMTGTDNAIRLEGVSIDQISKGKIKEHLAIADFTQFIQQFAEKK